MVRHHVLGFTALALLGCASWAVAGCGSTNGTNTGNQSQTQGDAGDMEASNSGSSSGGGASGDSGSSSDGGKGEAGQDAGHTPSSTYPAFPVDIAQVINNGGPVLTAPHIVTVTWASDPNAKTWEAFDDNIGASMYWHAVNSEYGVGPATSNPATDHVSIMGTAPSALSDQDLDTLVSTNVGNGTWPANTPNTIYAVYMPPGAGLLFGGAADAGGQDACAGGVGGYHDETQTGSYVYAIMPQCPMFQTADIEISASHELNEAATDPHPNKTPAWVSFDNDHLSYEFFQGFQDELGDACELYYWTSFSTTEANFSYAAQRQWSNASAKAGHNPCVPVPTGPNYSVTAIASELTTINVSLSALGSGNQTAQTKGYKGTLNQPLTFHLGAYSDGPTSGPWDVTTSFDLSNLQNQNTGAAITNGTATVTLDKSSVVNGDTITVTVTPTNWGEMGMVFVYFKSLLPGKTSMDPHVDYPIIISQN